MGKTAVKVPEKASLQPSKDDHHTRISSLTLVISKPLSKNSPPSVFFSHSLKINLSSSFPLSSRKIVSPKALCYFHNVPLLSLETSPVFLSFLSPPKTSLLFSLNLPLTSCPPLTQTFSLKTPSSLPPGSPLLSVTRLSFTFSPSKNISNRPPSCQKSPAAA